MRRGKVMRKVLAATLALEPLSVKADGSSRAADAFREGDEVVPAAGAHQGTPVTFLRLRSNINWADITERNGNIRLTAKCIGVWEDDGGALYSTLVKPEAGS
jgi:hypothetical protein